MRRTVVWALLGFAALCALVLATRSVTGAAASTVGRGALGWRGFALLLEHRGVEVARLERALGHGEPLLADTLVIAFPWQRGGQGFDPAPVASFVRRGGRLVLGSSGGVPTVPEQRLLAALGATWIEREAGSPLRPLRWWRARRAGEQWPPARAVPWRAPLRTPTLRAIARPADATEATALAVDAQGDSVASGFRHGAGEVWLLPSASLANAYLGEPGNAALALTLADALGARVVFDEYHHGLLGGADPDTEPARRSFDAVLLQLALLWGIALAAFAWRFGPTWPPPQAPADAHRSYLVGLGALHHRLGHDREAARALVERVARYAPASLPPQRVERALERARSVPFLQLARELSRSGAPR